MTNKTLKDTLIDLYHSGDLVPVWDEDDEGRFVADLELSEYGIDIIAMWFMKYGDDIIAETLFDKGPIMATCGHGSELGRFVRSQIEYTAVDWVKNGSEWDEAKAHITELENSR